MRCVVSLCFYCVVRCAWNSGRRVVRCAIVSGLVRGVVMRYAVFSGPVMVCVSGTAGRYEVLSGLVERCAVVRDLVSQSSLFRTSSSVVRCVVLGDHLQRVAERLHIIVGLGPLLQLGPVANIQPLNNLPI